MRHRKLELGKSILVYLFVLLFSCALVPGVFAFPLGADLTGTVTVNESALTAAADASWITITVDPVPATVTIIPAATTVGSGAGDNYLLSFSVVNDSGDPDYDGHTYIRSGETVNIYINGTLTDQSPVTIPATFGFATETVNLTATISTSTIAKSNDAQSGTVGDALGSAFTVTVKDASGNAIKDVTVTFAVASGGGSISPLGEVVTDANGQATTTLTLGETAGTNTVTAGVSGLDDVTFTATGAADAASELVIAAAPTTLASNQLGTATVTATITDQYGNTITTDSSTVTFTISDAEYAGFTDSSGNAIAGTSTNVTAVNGVATIYITSKTGTLADAVVSSPQTLDLTADAGDLNVQYPSDDANIILSVVDFSLATNYENILTGGTTTLTVYGASGESDTPSVVTAPTLGTLGSFTYDSGTVTFTATYTAGSTTGSDTVKVHSDDLGVDSNSITINVYNAVAIDPDTTDETLTLAAGGTNTFEVTGGDGTYTWSVTNPDSQAADDTLDATSGGSVVFTAPSTGNYAGEYTITVDDTASNNIAGTSYTVIVPLGTVSMTTANILETQTTTFSVAGASTGITWSIVDSAGDAITDADTLVGTLDGEITNTTVLTTADVSAVTDFYVKAVKDSLAATAKTSQTARVIPVQTYTGQITDSDAVGLNGIVLTVTSDVDIATDSVTTATVDTVDGIFSIDLPDTGTVYSLFVTGSGLTYKPTTITTTQIGTTGDYTLALEALTQSVITGNVTKDGTNAPEIASVVAYYVDADSEKQFTDMVYTNSAGDYILVLPSDWPSPYSNDSDYSAYTAGVVAEGYVAASVAVGDGSASGHGIANVTSLTALAPLVTTALDISESVAGGVVTLSISATPAFDDTSGELVVTLVTGATGTLVAPVFAAGTYTVDYDVDEDFSVTIDADTVDRVTTDGTLATLTYSYSSVYSGVSSNAAAPVEVDATLGGSDSYTGTSGDTVFYLLEPGSLDTATLTDDVVTLVVIQMSEIDISSLTDTSAVSGSGNAVYDIDLIAYDTAGEVVNTSDDKNYISGYITISIPFDINDVTPGAFEAGTRTIVHAKTLADLLAGSSTAVPSSDILSADYINGTVTFRVSSLSVFGIGGAAAGGAGDDDSNCFIATAAYGSPLEAHVETLRKFRDVYLLPTKLGHAFVEAYYRLSPPIAGFIADHEFMRTMVRWSLAPVVGMSWLALQVGMMPVLLFIFFFMGIGAAFFYIRRTPRSARA